VQKAYGDLKEAGRLEKPETADVAHILVKAERGGDEEKVAAAKKEIDEARERIVEGKEEFGEVAKEVSEDESSASRGGTYENVPKGRMVPEFEERMFDLPVGEVSEPFQTQFGWHILKVNARKEAGTTELVDVEEELREALESRAKGMAFNEYLESATDEVDIEILLPRKEEAADPAEAPNASGEEESEEPDAEDVELPDEPA
jgi:foldase protein PrsA